MRHLTLRVAWHDNRWNGAICRAPSCNSFCVQLDRIREERDDVREDELAGAPWHTLNSDQLPPCVAESGGFMNSVAWTRVQEHPYRSSSGAAATHGNLKPTPVQVPEYSTLAVPFLQMLRGEQSRIDETLPIRLPEDEEPPFPTAWVFGRARQEALLRNFFDQIRPERSLVFFYCKEGQPLGDSIPRLVVGVGRVLSVGPLRYYDSDTNTTYPTWDRIIRHSIRPDGTDGLLLPYHDYLESTGDPDEDSRRFALLAEIAIAADPTHIRDFSYVSELTGPEVALSSLVKCLKSIQRVREHGIAKGPWAAREEWLNEQMAAAWKDRGCFPGTGSALEAMGLRLGTALFQELSASGEVGAEDDPWPLVDAILQGKRKPPQPAYDADIAAVRKTWINLSEERRALLMLLSRFDLKPAQALRWFDPAERKKATRGQVTDTQLLSNPYLISENDLGDGNELPVSIGLLDRGLLPDSTIAVKHPIPAPSAIGSPNDERRIQAALVSVLRAASDDGDSLLSAAEARDRVSLLDLSLPCTVGSDWLSAHQDKLTGIIGVVQAPLFDDTDERITAIQLSDLQSREESLAKILRARAERSLPSLNEDWKSLLQSAINSTGAAGTFNPKNQRHVDALEEQARALESVTTRKLGVLIGRAGTGKTSALGALLKCNALQRGGVLLLAPTGKARVKLGKAAGAGDSAVTVAQFLNGLKRYDTIRQRPLFDGEKHIKEKTVVVDECSMLTMDDLAAILKGLDLGHVQRLILVGDPNQLPPIGVGRPFADLVGMLEKADQPINKESNDLASAMGRLSIEVRASEGAPSDTLRLASWFTREAQPVDADRVLSDLDLEVPFNDLEICFWRTPDELRDQLQGQLEKQLGLNGPFDVEGFNLFMGINGGLVPLDAPDQVEKFQILSPVRMHPHGVHDLNRWIQRQFRKTQLQAASKGWKTKLGDEDLVALDKVIQVSNERRSAWDGKSNTEGYLANGEIGVLMNGKSGWLNAVFAGRPNLRFGYRRGDFAGGSGPLQLAYALTVHKAQGSEFGKVFVVLPANCGQLLSRELLYTALTRSRDRLILLIEGDNASRLYELSRPESSETLRRNTNLFKASVRKEVGSMPFAEHLIHRTLNGEMVRSKSELVIANILYGMGLDYTYERLLEGTEAPGKRRPDFSFVDPAGDLIVWEHLGLLTREDYRRDWDRKREWYKANGYTLGKNLFTTRDDERGGLDSAPVKQVAETIRAIL